MKCFYHNSDLDGHCSGAIVKIHRPECELIGINYGYTFPWEKLEEGEEVYMVDFSLPMEDMQRLNKLCRLHWIDHHKTAIDAARAVKFLASGGQFLDTMLAACEATWRYLSDAPMPLAVHLLGRYDVWSHTDSRVLELQYGMRLFEDTRPTEIDFWYDIIYDEILVNRTIEQGKLILHYETLQNKRICKGQSFLTKLGEFKAICINRGLVNSKIFDSMYDENRVDVMIAFSRSKYKKWNVSIYSTRDDIDCGLIAKHYGGGGNKGAAGFQCVDLPFEI